MPDELTLIADQLRRLHEGDAWHGPSLHEALDGVSAEMAGRAAVPHAHTIYAITHHVGAWAAEVLARLGGRPPRMPDDGDFPVSEGPVTPAAWNAVKARMEATHRALIAAILAFDPARLHEPVGDQRDAPLGTGVTFHGMLHGLVQHDAYHAGQLVMLRRTME